MSKLRGSRGFLVGLAVGLLTGGAVAWAAVPDNTTGAVTACYPTSGANKGALRVIDAQAGTQCAAGEASVALSSTHACLGFPRPGVDWSLPGSSAGHGCDFSGVVLTGQNLIGANLTNGNFTGAEFVFAKLTDAKLNGANLTGAALCAASGTGLNLTGANLTNAVLTSSNGFAACAVPSATTLSQVQGLTSGQLRSIRKSGRASYCGGPTQGVEMSRVHLTNTNLAGFTLTDFILSEADLTGDNLSGAKLQRVDAHVPVGHGTLFRAVNLTNANLTCASMYGVDFTDANLTGANFHGTGVGNALWSNTTCPDGTNSDDHGNTCEGHLTASGSASWAVSSRWTTAGRRMGAFRSGVVSFPHTLNRSSPSYAASMWSRSHRHP